MIGILIAVAPMDKTAMILDEEVESNAYAIVCRAQDDQGTAQGMLWVVSGLALNIIMLLWGVYQAYQVRNVSAVFGESKLIGFVMYNLFIFGGIGVLIGFFTEANPAAQHMLISLMNLLACLGVLLIMWIPKYFLTKAYAADVAPMSLAKSSTNATATSATSATASSNNIYDDLKSVLSRIYEIDSSKLKGDDDVDSLKAAAAQLLGLFE